MGRRYVGVFDINRDLRQKIDDITFLEIFSTKLF